MKSLPNTWWPKPDIMLGIYNTMFESFAYYSNCYLSEEWVYEKWFLQAVVSQGFGPVWRGARTNQTWPVNYTRIRENRPNLCGKFLLDLSTRQKKKAKLYNKTKETGSMLRQPLVSMFSFYFLAIVLMLCFIIYFKKLWKIGTHESFHRYFIISSLNMIVRVIVACARAPL